MISSKNLSEVEIEIEDQKQETSRENESVVNQSKRQDQLEEIKSSIESEYGSSMESTELFEDPLFEDKRYLVTMIYTSFTQLGQPVTTTKEFYRIGNKLG